MAKNKVETFIGFCVKSRNIVYGSGSIDVQRRGVYVILLCSSAQKNTVKLALKFSRRFNCPVMLCKCGLENAVNKPGCKIAAVKDKNLAEAILANACEEYEIYAGGVES